jgi:hypothetical protein
MGEAGLRNKGGTEDYLLLLFFFFFFFFFFQVLPYYSSYAWNVYFFFLFLLQIWGYCLLLPRFDMHNCLADSLLHVTMDHEV